MFIKKCGAYIVKNTVTAADIEPETDIRQNIHVFQNPETGRLDGWPKSWSKFWNQTQTTSKFYTTENENLLEETPSTSTIEIKKKVEEQIKEFLKPWYGPVTSSRKKLNKLELKLCSFISVLKKIVPIRKRSNIMLPPNVISHSHF